MMMITTTVGHHHHVQDRTLLSQTTLRRHMAGQQAVLLPGEEIGMTMMAMMTTVRGRERIHIGLDVIEIETVIVVAA